MITFCVCSQLWAQKELSNWYFGSGDGLSWNSRRSLEVKGVAGTPDAILTGLPVDVSVPMNGNTYPTINTNEGCFTMSDKWGNLLFYSDGTYIWNKNHQRMTRQNGSAVTLTGNKTSAQSGIVIKYPGSDTKYIAFAVDKWYENNLSYAIIDMALNEGLGFVTDIQNISTGTNPGPQLGLLGESISAVRHPNLKDFWLIAVGKSAGANLSTYMNVWKITESGGIQFDNAYPFDFDSSDVTTGLRANGYLTFNARGNHFVWPVAPGLDGISEITIFGTFNPETGVFGSIRQFTPGVGYGAEFSLSGKYVYLPSVHDGYYNETYPRYPVPLVIRIFDFEELLTASDPNTVTPYKEIYPDSEVTSQSAAQMGLDGRMYIISNGYYEDVDPVTGKRQPNKMIIIDNPEDIDNLRIYYADNILSNPSAAALGIPTFSKSWLLVNIEGDRKICRGTTQQFSIDLDEFASDGNYLIWDWGDGNQTGELPVTAGTQIYSDSHKYDKPGFYTIAVSVYNNESATIPVLFQTYDIEIVICGIYVNPHLQSVIKLN